MVEPLRDLGRAEAAGWDARVTPCLESPEGGMGYHYANPSLLRDGSVAADSPEALVYEPLEDGTLQLVAAAYAVPFAFAQEAPRLFDQEFVAHEEAGIWALHVWVGEENSAGLFASWSPEVACRHAADDSPAVALDPA